MHYMELKHLYDMFYVDLIVKLIICRSYLNIKAKKLLTAEKILDTAKQLIMKHSQKTYKDYYARLELELIDNKSRLEIPIIPIFILK